MEDELKNIVESVLDIPCYIDADTITYPSAEVQVYQDNPELFGDGKAQAVISYVALDLWYKERIKRDNAVKVLVPEIVNAGYTHPTCERYYDITAKKYRATLNFSKKKEEHNGK